MADQTYWEDVSKGQEIPSFFRKTDLMNWNRWASVNDEYVPMHMDDDAAKENGQPGAFGQGPLAFGGEEPFFFETLHQLAEGRLEGPLAEGFHRKDGKLKTAATFVEGHPAAHQNAHSVLGFETQKPPPPREHDGAHLGASVLDIEIGVARGIGPP